MRTRNEPRSTRLRILGAFTLIVCLAAATNAYTVVMRGGRRVEIPSRFVVTTSTLTYEVSPGVQITIALAAIDFAETEKVNHEAPGSFLRRVQAASTQSQESPQKETPALTATPRTITNRDLEASMRRRHESEIAYEGRRKELGLPSVEASREKAAMDSASIASELAQTRNAEKENEAYWRARASALRTEIAAVDAELGYIRRQLDEPLFPAGYGSYTSLVNVVPFISFGRFGRGSFGSLPSHRPGIFVAPGGGSQLRGQAGFGNGAPRGRVFPNPSRFPHAGPMGAPLVAPFLVPPSLGVFGSTYDLSYDRNLLITRFNELAATRAGLSARWRELEDEARRAGAPPGWLRP